MFDHTHYMPILKGKAAEYGSLQRLDSEVKSRLTPLIDVPPIPWDFINDKPSRSIDEHLEDIANTLLNCWEEGRPVFIDVSQIPDEERMQNGEHPLAYVHRSCRDKGVHSIPVISAYSDTPSKEAAKEAAGIDGRGICIRLVNEELEEFQEDPERFLSELLSFLEVGPEEVDLVIDFQELPQSAPMGLIVRSVLKTIPSVHALRTLTLASTSFPQHLGEFPSAAVSTPSRSEWILWREIIENPRGIERVPTFGDYAIAHPEIFEIDPRIMRMTANLRYTADSEWVILKGRNVRKHGYGQMHDLCHQLANRPEYMGEDFSWGDEWIMKCANRETGPGNATTWRLVGTTHHLTFVTHQLASLRGA